MTATVFKLLAVAPPGLEDVVFQEVGHHFENAKVVPGGVEIKTDFGGLIKANLALHTPTRILVRLGTFKVTGFQELIQKTARYPWEIYVNKKIPLKIRVTTRHSKLWHSGAVKERVVEGISKRLGFRPKLVAPGAGDVPSEYQLVVCRIVHNRCTLQVDSSGEFLFKRGYKAEKGLAPLRENLAACLIIASGWDRTSPFLDPFCGTGTIAIEAALMSRAIPPGKGRVFPFKNWRIYDGVKFDQVLRELIDNMASLPEKPVVFASDIDEAMLRAARKNASIAGVEGLIQFERSDFKHLTPPVRTPGWIVTNPPFGRRLKEGGHRRFADTIIRQIVDRFTNWHTYLLIPMEWAHALRRWGAPILSFDHGGLKVALFRMSKSPSRR